MECFKLFLMLSLAVLSGRYDCLVVLSYISAVSIFAELLELIIRLGFNGVIAFRGVKSGPGGLNALEKMVSNGREFLSCFINNEITRGRKQVEFGMDLIIVSGIVNYHTTLTENFTQGRRVLIISRRFVT